VARQKGHLLRKREAYHPLRRLHARPSPLHRRTAASGAGNGPPRGPYLSRCLSSVSGGSATAEERGLRHDHGPVDLAARIPARRRGMCCVSGKPESPVVRGDWLDQPRMSDPGVPARPPTRRDCLAPQPEVATLRAGGDWESASIIPVRVWVGWHVVGWRDTGA